MRNAIKPLAQSGYVAVVLLVFVTVTIVVAGAAASLSIVALQSSTGMSQSQLTYAIAESGIENALIRLLRDPAYGGETLPVGNGQAEITVSGTSQQTIISTGQLSGYERSIQVEVERIGGVLSITSWQEVHNL